MVLKVTLMSTIGLALGLVTGNFLWVLIQYLLTDSKPSISTAVERSFFQIVALFALWIANKSE